jgi:hypothetical protein
VLRTETALQETAAPETALQETLRRAARGDGCAGDWET